MIKEKLLQRWHWLEADNHRSFYLAFLRVAISVWLLKEVLLNWSSNELMYGPNALIRLRDYGLEKMLFIDLKFLETHFVYFIAIYVLLLLLNIAGIGKWVTALLLFICYDALQKQSTYVYTGGEKMAKLILFYLVFANSYEYFSLRKPRPKTIHEKKLNNLLSNLAALSIILQLCLSYFASGLAKLDAALWRNGTATYYTFIMERFAGTSLNKQLVQHAWFVYITTYFTLAFELLFPFLIWFKPCRKPLAVMGFILHAGIYVFMMIYGFQLVFLLTYGLLFSNKSMLRLYEKLLALFSRKKLAL